MTDKDRIVELEKKVERITVQQDLLLKNLEQLIKIISEGMAKSTPKVPDNFDCACGGKVSIIQPTFPNFVEYWECNRCGTIFLPN